MYLILQLSHSLFILSNELDNRFPDRLAKVVDFHNVHPPFPRLTFAHVRLRFPKPVGNLLLCEASRLARGTHMTQKQRVLI